MEFWSWLPSLMTCPTKSMPTDPIQELRWLLRTPIVSLSQTQPNSRPTFRSLMELPLPFHSSRSRQVMTPRLTLRQLVSCWTLRTESSRPTTATTRSPSWPTSTVSGLDSRSYSGDLRRRLMCTMETHFKIRKHILKMERQKTFTLSLDHMAKKTETTNTPRWRHGLSTFLWQRTGKIFQSFSLNETFTGNFKNPLVEPIPQMLRRSHS